MRTPAVHSVRAAWPGLLLPILGCLAALFLVGCSGQRNDASAELPETPQRIYDLHCMGCHGEKGEGESLGPNIQGLDRPTDRIVKVIAEGGGRMPAFRGHLTLEQMRQVAEYVKTFKLPK